MAFSRLRPMISLTVLTRGQVRRVDFTLTVGHGGPGSGHAVTAGAALIGYVDSGTIAAEYTIKQHDDVPLGRRPIQHRLP